MDEKYQKLHDELGQNDNEPVKKKSKLREWLGIAIFAGLGAGLMLLFNTTYCFEHVSGKSMNDTYQDGDLLLVKRNKGTSYDYEDVVILDLKNREEIGSDFIKRVIGKEGDVIDIDFKTGAVTRNGEVLNEPYIKELTFLDEGGHEYPVTVPEGCYFVMGDNRNDSLDSRSEKVGFVPEKEIKGKVIKRLPDIIAKIFG